MYETRLDAQLPVLWARDPFLQQAREMAGEAVANAHDFDAVYEQDRPILWGLTAEPALSHETYDIHNNQETRYGYQTNGEVEDFIDYLDTEIVATGVTIGEKHISGPRVVSIIKQMLGLEQKKQGTRGGFAPYLSSSMYYAKPEAPTGDEMLGRTWAFMKNLAKRKGYPTEEAWKKDVEDYKKSVVFALLEAAEISGAGVDTHCQTRTSGELFKMLAWHLPGSKLRELIAAPDSIVARDGSIEKRIAEAPLNAQIVFRGIKDEGTGEIRRLFERCDSEGRTPELWEQYEAYYDTLYRRTKVDEGAAYNPDIHIRLSDGRMYKKDEHILMRDGRGNLVSPYNADGTLREMPIIIYHQAQFQVLEHTFTQLMKREFEDQRGLKY